MYLFIEHEDLIFTNVATMYPAYLLQCTSVTQDPTFGSGGLHIGVAGVVIWSGNFIFN